MGQERARRVAGNRDCRSHDAVSIVPWSKTAADILPRTSNRRAAHGHARPLGGAMPGGGVRTANGGPATRVEGARRRMPGFCFEAGNRGLPIRVRDAVLGAIGRVFPRDEGGRGSTALAAGPMLAGLVGSERVRRHPHRRARSAPQCGVSRGPRACRVRVPIETGRRPPRGGRTGRFAQAADFPLFGGLRCQRRGVANLVELLPKLSLIIHEIAVDLGVAQQRSDI